MQGTGNLLEEKTEVIETTKKSNFFRRNKKHEGFVKIPKPLDNQSLRAQHLRGRKKSRGIEVVSMVIGEDVVRALLVPKSHRSQKPYDQKKIDAAAAKRARRNEKRIQNARNGGGLFVDI